LTSSLARASWTLPDYAGGSVLNLASSLATHFGVSAPHPVLRDAPGLEGAETVVLLIVDGLGKAQLERHISDGIAPNFAALLAHGTSTTLTSVFPSTTMAAMTAIHTARAPNESGWLGYTLWLEETGTLTEMIAQVALPDKKPLPRKEFLRVVPNIYSAYANAGVSVYTVQPREYRGSWLNEWYWAGAQTVEYASANTVSSVALEALEGSGRKLVILYWADYDTVCHAHGPSSLEASDEFAGVDAALGRLVQRLPRDGKTALLVTADHGQIDLDPREQIHLERDVWLAGHLQGAPGGERLGRTLRLKPGQLEAVEAHVRQYGDVIRTAEAWDAGLFGGAPALETFRARVGDLIVLPCGGTQLGWSFSAKHLSTPHLGSHGGLSHDQMRVPLLTLRV
jgi:hypothetical protein